MVRCGPARSVDPLHSLSPHRQFQHGPPSKPISPADRPSPMQCNRHFAQACWLSINGGSVRTGMQKTPWLISNLEGAAPLTQEPARVGWAGRACLGGMDHGVPGTHRTAGGGRTQLRFLKKHCGQTAAELGRMRLGMPAANSVRCRCFCPRHHSGTLKPSLRWQRCGGERLCAGRPCRSAARSSPHDGP